MHPTDDCRLGWRLSTGYWVHLYGVSSYVALFVVFLLMLYGPLSNFLIPPPPPNGTVARCNSIVLEIILDHPSFGKFIVL